MKNIIIQFSHWFLPKININFQINASEIVTRYHSISYKFILMIYLVLKINKKSNNENFQVLSLTNNPQLFQMNIYYLQGLLI